ncbi:MAG: threonine--tRNA ligase, partial [Acidobacteria bacterium]|nr:threonine--tRNA ligase [Acidobacteriota bacterium]
MAVATDTIKISFPDGSTQEFPKGTTVLEVVRAVNPRLAKEAIVARVNGGLVELKRPLEKDTPLEILTAKNPEALQVYRHSSAHLLAAAVLELFPGTQLGIGPPTETGFFYDFYREEPFTPEDLEKIEKKMQELVNQDLPYDRLLFPKEEGLNRFAAMGERMKCELIDEKAENVFSCYTLGPNFIDFCRGPHIPSTGYVRAFKLLSVAGAYWKGDEHNQPMQRIYGTSFFTPKELEAYLHQLEEAKKRDHRKLGRELDLFSIQEEAGAGLIFWHPKGAIIRKVMEDWLREEYLRRGYALVYTPHVARLDLWKRSGHVQWFAPNMFPPMKLEDAEYQLKPMNCPFHILIYKDKLHSYRDLPVRFGELGTVYRYERSGVMHGLLRVRGFTQDDAHIFCAPEQMEEEVLGCLDFALEVLRAFGFEEFKVELSTWDQGANEKYGGSPEQWKQAEASLSRSLEKRGIPFQTITGEAAFYGPKIDVKLVDAIGRLWQLSTVQFDFTLPERFDLYYVAEDGKHHRPVMVHRALWGSVERFFGVLVEHYAGAFPVWLAPVQAVVLPISEKLADYAQQTAAKLRAAGFRVELD